jgi:hypothetical protein
MDVVSGATARPCPHRIRVVTHAYEDIYGRSTQNAKIFQNGISPKWALNQEFVAKQDHVCGLIPSTSVSGATLEWAIYTIRKGCTAQIEE